MLWTQIRVNWRRSKFFHFLALISGRCLHSNYENARHCSKGRARNDEQKGKDNSRYTFLPNGHETYSQFLMKYSKDQYDWLDEMLRKVLHVTDVAPDFEAWRREHAQAVDALNANATATERPSEDQETQE